MVNFYKKLALIGKILRTIVSRRQRLHLYHLPCNQSLYTLVKSTLLERSLSGQNMNYL